MNGPGAPRVLLVSRSPIAAVWEEALVAAGFEVVRASAVAAALVAARESPPDALLVDDLGSLRALRREPGVLEAVPVVLSTRFDPDRVGGAFAPVWAADAAATGADYYRPEVVVERVRDVVRRGVRRAPGTRERLGERLWSSGVGFLVAGLALSLWEWAAMGIELLPRAPRALPPPIAFLLAGGVLADLGSRRARGRGGLSGFGWTLAALLALVAALRLSGVAAAG